MIHQYAAGI